MATKSKTSKGKTPKKTKLGQALIEGLKQAIAYEKGELKGLRTKTIAVTAREVSAPPAPKYSAEEIKALRESAAVSQAVFAQALTLNPDTVRAWEQGKRKPSGPALRLLEMVEHHPDWLFSRVHAR